MNVDLLRGVRIIESSAFIAAPLAGMTLAQFGADVIRIDPIGGGLDYRREPVMPKGRSFYWTGLNKCKRSLAVDIRRKEGKELIRSLVTAPGEKGGILLTNIGTPWLSHDSLKELRSDLISCTIEGNPDRTTAVDYTVNCATGFPALTGNEDSRNPVNHVLPAWDIACAYQAAMGIVSAVLHRTLSGRGSELRLALSDVAFSMLSHLGMLTEVEKLQKDRQSSGNYLYGAFGKDFLTKDGYRIYIAGVSSGQWKSLISACGLHDQIANLEKQYSADFNREADRFNARKEIAVIIGVWCKARTYREIKHTFDSRHVCWGTYQTIKSALSEDARVSTENEIFENITTEGIGSHLAAGTPLRLGDTPRGKITPAPVLGQHTDQVLQEILGFDTSRIEGLKSDGVVAGTECDPYFLK